MSGNDARAAARRHLNNGQTGFAQAYAMIYIGDEIARYCDLIERLSKPPVAMVWPPQDEGPTAAGE